MSTVYDALKGLCSNVKYSAILNDMLYMKIGERDDWTRAPHLEELLPKIPEAVIKREAKEKKKK
jgi:hypothetical protein